MLHAFVAPKRGNSVTSLDMRHVASNLARRFAYALESDTPSQRFNHKFYSSDDPVARRKWITTVQKQKLDPKTLKAVSGGAAGVGLSLRGNNGTGLGLGSSGLNIRGTLGSLGLGASVNKSA